MVSQDFIQALDSLNFARYFPHYNIKIKYKLSYNYTLTGRQELFFVSDYSIKYFRIHMPTDISSNGMTA